jgi:hypothetical protein
VVEARAKSAGFFPLGEPTMPDLMHILLILSSQLRLKTLSPKGGKKAAGKQGDQTRKRRRRRRRRKFSQSVSELS